MYLHINAMLIGIPFVLPIENIIVNIIKVTEISFSVKMFYFNKCIVFR